MLLFNLQILMSAQEVTITVIPMPPVLTPLKVSTAPATLDTLAMDLMAHAWTLMNALIEVIYAMSMQIAQTQLETTHVIVTLVTLEMDFNVKVRNL